MPIFHFPFGQPLYKVEQADKNAKSAFVLGVYASAVHAQWLDTDSKQKVSALAVASEPSIFWCGENAAELIGSIKIPKEVESLKVPKDTRLNGPSDESGSYWVSYINPIE